MTRTASALVFAALLVTLESDAIAQSPLRFFRLARTPAREAAERGVLHPAGRETAERALVRAAEEQAAKRLAAREATLTAERMAASTAAQQQTTRAAIQRVATHEMRSASRAFSRVRDPGVVYVRVDPHTLRLYIGRSKNTSGYLRRQLAHDAKLRTPHQYSVITTSAESGHRLRVAEETAIRINGGKKILANRRMEMNEAAFRQAGGTAPMPAN